MELDDLKQGWNKQSENELKTLNNNFMEMIHNKSYGPLAALKHKMRQQLIAFLLLVAIFICEIIYKPGLFKESFSLMCFFGTCVFILAGFYWRNYKLVGQMQETNSSVKETIETNLRKLESNFKRYFVVGRFYFVLAVIVVEVFMHLHLIKEFEPWYAYSIFIRISSYIVLYVATYFIGKYKYQKDFGKHIAYLKELLEKI